MNQEPVICHEIHADLGSCVFRESSPNWGRFILLLNGSARLEDGTAISSPILGWHTAEAGPTLRFDAGSKARILCLPEQTVIALEQLKLDMRDNPLFPSQSVNLDLKNAPLLRDRMLDAFLAITDEVEFEFRQSRTLIFSNLWIIVINLWRRIVSENMAVGAQTNQHGVLQRFLALVETHYRERWTVTRYARQIGVSHDRLHNICRQQLDRPPLQIIHARLVQEAQTALERSTLSIEQISSELGFGDSTQFSHFFKRMNGQSPKKYRQEYMKEQQVRFGSRNLNYADWP